MITPSALKQLAKLQFHIVTPPENEAGDLLERLPFIVFDRTSFPARFVWRMPSVGDAGMDMLIGQVMGLGYLVLELTLDGDPEARNIFEIAEALRNGNASEMQLLGFFFTLEQFMKCALHDPEQFAALRDRLKQLTDDDLNARYRAVLRGETPPDFFGDGAEGGSK